MVQDVSHNMRTPNRHRSRSRSEIRVLSINVGGLNPSFFDELRISLSSAPFDIIHIQETKWTFTSEWADSQWFYVHSGSKQRHFKQGGLLTMVRKTGVQCVDHAEIIPGGCFMYELPGHIVVAQTV